MQVRGSSSQRHDRKSYSFELKDDEWDDDKDFPLLGEAACENTCFALVAKLIVSVLLDIPYCLYRFSSPHSSMKG
jgi:hypothetical protein